MNGMMVPLLILMMTGTVVGQHFGDSSQFRTQSSPTSHSTGNQGNFSPAAKVQPSQLAPFELSVSNEDIQGLKRTGAVLSSKIEPRDPSTGRILSPEVINGISLVHKNNLNRELPEREIKAENAGNGLIRFGLNDHDLLNLQNNKLSFSFDAADRGRFNAVQFYYKKPAQQSNFVRPSEDTGLPNFSPANSRPSFAKTPSHNDLLPLLPPPGPEELPGGIAFEGPVRPLSIPNSQPQRNFGFASTNLALGVRKNAQSQTQRSINPASNCHRIVKTNFHPDRAANLTPTANLYWPELSALSEKSKSNNSNGREPNKIDLPDSHNNHNNRRMDMPKHPVGATLSRARHLLHSQPDPHQQRTCPSSNRSHSAFQKLNSKNESTSTKTNCRLVRS